MSTKYFDLFSALKAGGAKGVSPESLTKALDFSASSLAVYIHALRHKFGAAIDSVRNGRIVVSYRLTNAAEMESKIPSTRKSRVVKKTKTVRVATTIKKTKAIVKTAAKTTISRKAKRDDVVPVIDDLSVSEITNADLDDIKNQLGIA